MVTAPSPVSLLTLAIVMSAQTDEAAQAANGITTRVVPDGGGDASYSMLESTELSADGAFLGGSLFFEVDEEFNLQFSRRGSDSLRLRVRVVEIERGDEPGMWVEFVALGDAERKSLTELIGDK